MNDQKKGTDPIKGTVCPFCNGVPQNIDGDFCLKCGRPSSEYMERETPPYDGD